MRILNQQSAEELLRRQGLSLAKISEVLGSFNLKEPLYEHDFWDKEILYQLKRVNASIGMWFGLPGITTKGVAINDGLSGRILVKFRVTIPFKALEGTAKSMKKDYGIGIGGPGGQTQICIPPILQSRLEVLGQADRWQ